MFGLTTRTVSVGTVTALALASVVAGTAGAAKGPRCFGRRATIVGSARSERLNGTARDDVIVAKAGDDRVKGGGGDDLICGGRGSDVMFGGRGDDSVSTGRGSFETLAGNEGSDHLDGGPGFGADVRYATSPGPVIVDLRVGRAAGEGADSIVNVDQVIGSRFDDVIYGTEDPEEFNFLLGLDGKDALYGMAGGDFLGGGAGDDALDGGEGFDFANNIYGYAEFDQPVTGVVVDLAAGTVTGHGSDTLTAIEGSTGTIGDDTFTGNDEDNEFTQMFEGNDSANGAGGDDLIDLGDGTDTADGGPGTDIIGHLDHTTGVTVDLGAGTSTGAETDQITAFEGIIGSTYDDTLTGDNQDNFIEGDFGSDTMSGLQGNDTLIGDILGVALDPDADVANGAQGTDVCVAETETECEEDPPAEPARRASVPLVRYHRLPLR